MKQSLEDIEDTYRFFQDNFKRIINGLANGGYSLDREAYSLFYHNFWFGFYQIVVKQEIKSSLNFFYRSSIAALYMARISKNIEKSPLETTLSFIFPGILSGNKRLINVWMSRAVHSPGFEHTMGRHFHECLIALYHKDMDSFNLHFPLFAKMVGSKWKGGRHYVPLFEGIVDRDLDKIHGAIKMLIRNRAHDPFTAPNNLFAMQGAFAMKFCYLIGLDVYFDTPYVPREFIFTDELPQYDEDGNTFDMVHQFIKESGF